MRYNNKQDWTISLVLVLLICAGATLWAGGGPDEYRRNELVNMMIYAGIPDSTIAELIKLPIYERSESISDSVIICLSNGGRVATRVKICEFKLIFDHTGAKQ